MFYVSPEQVNYQIPRLTATGPATAVVKSADGTVSKGNFQVDPVAPGLFSIDASGNGVVAAVAIHVTASGAQTVVPVFQCANGRCSSVPIDRGGETDQVILQLYGTGIRGRSSLANVTSFVEGSQATVLYAGEQGEFAGLDQVNIRLPRGPIGEVRISLEVDGKPTNTGRINLK